MSTHNITGIDPPIFDPFWSIHPMIKVDWPNEHYMSASMTLSLMARLARLEREVEELHKKQNGGGDEG